MGNFREDVRDQLEAIRETIVESWRDLRSFVSETWPALTVLFLLGGWAIWMADPAPPRHVSMAIGPEGSFNQVMGQKYADYFAKRGITLSLVPTEGSVENIRRLQDRADPIMAAFVMAGVAEKHAPGIQTLGSINYQPLWCFYHADTPISSSAERTRAVISATLNVGTPNSGTYLLTQKVIRMLGLDPDSSRFKQLSDHDAVEALRKKEINGMCVVDAYESPNVQTLLAIPGLQLSPFDRAEAYTRLVSSIEKVTVPEGSLDLATNRPAQPLPLIATTTEILIDDRLHPAIQTLFLMASRAINSKQSFFSNEGEFPAFHDSTLLRSQEAMVFYEKGTPLLMEFMPFWLAEFVRRLFLTMLPFFAVAYPIIRSMPNYHKNRVRSRINRMYGALKFFEQSLLNRYDPGQKSVYLAQLDGMEREALEMKVPKSIAGDYYTLRTSIDFVRNCLIRDGYASGRVVSPATYPAAFESDAGFESEADGDQ